MHRPYEHCSNIELGENFAAAVRMGGRPVIRKGDQLGYADIVLEMILEEFRERISSPRLTLLNSPVEANYDRDDSDHYSKRVAEIAAARAAEAAEPPF